MAVTLGILCHSKVFREVLNCDIFSVDLTSVLSIKYEDEPLVTLAFDVTNVEPSDRIEGSGDDLAGQCAAVYVAHSDDADEGGTAVSASLLKPDVAVDHRLIEGFVVTATVQHHLWYSSLRPETRGKGLSG